MTKKTRMAWLLCVLWMGVIFLASATPGEISGEQSSGVVEIVLTAAAAVFGEEVEQISPQSLELILRKGAHMAEYAVLFALLRRALRLSGVRHAAAAAFALCVLYAATDEFHQRFVPGRGPSVVDVGIDALGAGLVWAIVCMSDCIKAHRKSRE